MNIINKIKLMLAAVALILSGCGGGGGGGAAGTYISGTAAAGAPVIGYVSVSDSSTNPQPVKTGIPIAADGKYSVDVSGLKAPYSFLADGTVGGKRVQLYSAATAADANGTINITPFTDLVIRNIAGTISTTLAAAIQAKLPNLTATEINTKVTSLVTQLTPVLQAAGLSTSLDLLRASFNADGTGLDRFMDLVKVDTTVPTAVTITNILDANNPLTVDPTNPTPSTTTLSAAGVTAATTPTPVDLINQTFANFGGYFATSLPSPTNTGLTALFSSTFMDDGINSAAFLTDITSSPQLVGLKASIVVDSVDTVAGTAKVHFTPLSGTGVKLANDMYGGAIFWQMKLENGVWKIDGNQRVAYVAVKTYATRAICSPTSASYLICNAGTSYSTGLALHIDNQGMKNIGSAVVTGPGLPVGGVTLTAQLNHTQLSLPCTNCFNNQYALQDVDIVNIPANSVYTVKLYDNATVPVLMATYTHVVPVAPVLNTALASTAYPSIDNASTFNFANYVNGGTITGTWTIPAGLVGDNISINVWTTTENWSVRASLAGATATSGSGSMVLKAPTTGSWIGANFWIGAWDQYTGRVNTFYQ